MEIWLPRHNESKLSVEDGQYISRLNEIVFWNEYNPHFGSSVHWLLQSPNQHLVTVTSTSKYSSSGTKLSGPGGKIDPGEEILSAAYREMHEETGLSTKDINLTGINGLQLVHQAEKERLWLNIYLKGRLQINNPRFTIGDTDVRRVQLTMPDVLMQQIKGAQNFAEVVFLDQLQEYVSGTYFPPKEIQLLNILNLMQEYRGMYGLVLF